MIFDQKDNNKKKIKQSDFLLRAQPSFPFLDSDTMLI